MPPVATRPEGSHRCVTPIHREEKATFTASMQEVTKGWTGCITTIRDLVHALVTTKVHCMVDVQPWIGFVHVQPAGGANPFGEGRKGAFTHVLALAAGADSFRDLASRTLEEYGLRVVDISDIAPVASYRAETRISAEMEELVELLSDEYPVQFAVFDTYLHHDA
jgi:hypothetical protein